MIGEDRENFSIFTLLSQYSPKYESKFENKKFWETYYRHNNYFYERNLTIFEEIRVGGSSKKGIEKLMMGNTPSDQQVQQDFMETIKLQEGMVSKWGIRAISLGDIIRYMAMLDIDLGVVTQICFHVSQKFSMDKRLAYSVFLETEHEFTLNNSFHALWKKDRREAFLTDRKINDGSVWQLVMPFLPPKDTLSLVMTNRSNYQKYHKKFVLHVCLHYTFDNVLRQ